MFANRSCIIVCMLSFTALLGTSIALGDGRTGSRLNQNPYSSDVSDVLETRGDFFEHSIGEDFIELAWVNDEVSLKVEGASISDIEQWVESSDPEVIAFSAYEGRGVLGPDGNAGLIGWLYLDEFGELQVELEVEENYVTYQITEQGEISVVAAQICRCRKPGFPTAGCTNTDCDATNGCPGSSGHYCAWKYGHVTAFEAQFNAVTD